MNKTIIIDEGITHITQCEEDSITEQELVSDGYEGLYVYPESLLIAAKHVDG